MTNWSRRLTCALKLAGADAHELSFNDTAPCGGVARSLSAIR